MEQIHGVDVSWMTHGNPKDKTTKVVTRPRSLSQSAPDAPPSTGTPPVLSSSPPPITPNGGLPNAATDSSITGRARQGSKSGMDDKRPLATPQRRGSWFSNISSKFSSGAGTSQTPPQTNNISPKPAELSVPRANPVKNAVLQHASKHEGEGPYIPAPPRSSQAGILHVFRRLSSSNGQLSPGLKPHNHGLVERRVLNVDEHRERCAIKGLHQAKLRRVAFCVDVEIAPMPKYPDQDAAKKLVPNADKAEKEQKKKVKEKGEGEALKHPQEVEAQKEENGLVNATGEVLPKEPDQEGIDVGKVSVTADEPTPDKPQEKLNAGDTKKKEKKKKSEEDRKARKEKKRKLAEANGTIPMELHFDSDASSIDTIPRPETPRAQGGPTTNPVRIYRRCCQLRETPILKKITEQLTNPANMIEPGMIEKLDLTGYWMQLSDLVTLGDYLAVVPVREVLLENCGLGDEGLRVVLAGLLAARKPSTIRKRKTAAEPEGLTKQGGVVERLVIKNNKLGLDGWRHVCLFLYLCRTLKSLDLSGIPFPRPPAQTPASKAAGPNRTRPEQDICRLLCESLGNRLGGSTLNLLSLGQAGLNTEQLGVVIDGITKCGIRRLCLAHNDIDPKGMEHVARYLRSGVCEGLDLGGNDLRDQLAVLADALAEGDSPLWALSLADCNLKPSSLCKLLPKLVKLDHFRFIDLSHNQELFSMSPNAIAVLRRYLPKMACLKRIHLADCAMSSEQVIALAEILPEIPGLAHISFLENPELVNLATNAKTDDAKEEACALYASLLAAARVSASLVAVDIEVPSEQSSDLVKAMAKQVVAYCLRNMELAAATVAHQADVLASKPEPEYPEALQRLVGHNVLQPTELDNDLEAAPDDDYVIGGQAVVKALACCLKNRGDDSRRQSGEFIRDLENGVTTQPKPGIPNGKAKETSKHLLSSARKIRYRLQPAIVKAKTVVGGETHAYHRLLFLDNTLKGIIKRFEDEFPDTRESVDSAIAFTTDEVVEKQLGTSPASSAEVEILHRESSTLSEIEDEVEADLRVRPSRLSRTNSAISLTSKALADEEGRVLRAGHKFRVAIVKPEHYGILSGVEMVGADPKHVRLLHELLDELADENLSEEVRNKGVVTVFQERKEEIHKRLRELDPVHWDRFVESQEMARKNVSVDVGGQGQERRASGEAVED